MKSDSKWRDQLRGNYSDSLTGNRSYGKDNYDDDDTVGMEYQESNFKSLIVAAAIAGGGYMGYKKGLFKYAIKTILEKANNYKGYDEAVSKALRGWAKKDVTNPQASLLRKNILSTAYKTATEHSYGGRIVQDTLDDLKALRNSVTQNINDVRSGNINTTRKAYTNTLFMKRLGEMENFINGLTGTNASRGVSLARKTITDDIIETMTLTPEKAEQQLKRTGYRPAMLKELLDVQFVNGRTVLSNKVNNIDIAGDQMVVTRLNKFLNTPINHRTATLISTNKYERLILDPNIMINEQGKIIDIRHASRSTKDFIQTLAHDFQLPVIHFNPIRMTRINEFIEQGNRTRYGLLHSATMQPTLTKTTGRHALGEFYGNDPLLQIGSNTYKFSDNYKNLVKVAENTFIEKIPKNAKHPWGLPTHINDLRTMANLNFIEPHSYTPANGTFKNLYGRLTRFLNIGYQDTSIKTIYNKNADFISKANPNTYIESALKWFGEKVKPYNTANNYNLHSVFGEVPEGQDMFVVFNKTRKFNDVFNPDNKAGTNIYNWGYQFVAGKGKEGAGFKNVTPMTSALYSTVSTLNRGLSMVNMGLSNKDLGSAGAIAYNLVLKRAFPAYLGYQGYQYLNYLTETDDGDNITKHVAKGIVDLDLGWHSVKDTLGITKVAKYFSPLMPGSEQITAIPGLNLLDLDDTEKEREQYYKTGTHLVRKGRYWDLGNTPFSGGKAMYAEPNWFRRIMADVNFSDVKYGSRDEYFKHFWLPTPQHPFSPITHFVTDKYHYEMKHYFDRPYLMSSPEFENVPIVGAFASGTIGRLIKPQIRMHEDYWNNNGGVTGASYNKTGGMLVGSEVNPKLDSAQVSGMPTGNKQYDIYQTSSGSMSVVGITGKDAEEVNQELKDYSIKRVEGSDARIDLSKVVGTSGGSNGSGMGEDNGDDDDLGQNPNDVDTTHNLSYMVGQEYNTITDVVGLRGFVMRGLGTGEGNVNKTVVETSGYAYSMNRSFWDMNIGGLGGELSEIGRRFIQRRDPNTKYFNPVRNTMPDWMPGADYFTDFQHGDPYTKVPKGEMRLPGAGYERLWGLDSPLNFHLDVDSIGKTTAEIQKHYLKQNTPTDPDEQRRRAADHKLTHKIEAMWLKSGIAVDTRGKVEDKDNNISGEYDARINDPSSDNGTAIATIVPLSERDYYKVKGSRDIREQDLRKANFVLRATGDQKGYVQYVNRDNPNDQISMSFKYDKGLWKDTLDTINEARTGIRKNVESGTIKPSDMYSTIDRYRILADSAPYSKEFQVVAAQVAKMKLTPDEKEQIKQIRNNMKETKSSMRIYDYKFKTANLVYQDIVVKKVIDADTFVAEGMEDHPIRLAGVHVIGDKSKDNYGKAQETIANYIHSGAHLKIGYTADSANMYAKDTLGTVRAVVYSHGTNVNRDMLSQNLATEKAKDWSPAGVHARFSAGQIAFGKVWETIAHFDSPINTKLLQVRSAKENYERREVYGKDFQSWTHPIKDFLIPTIQQNIHRPAGLIVGAWVGSMFSGTAYGTLIGAVAGFSTIAIGKAYASYYESKTGSKWVPERRRKQRDLNEYMDVLKYVKNRRLYALYAEQAKKKYNIDVQEMISQEKESGEKRKERTQSLKDVKREIKLDATKDKTGLLGLLQKLVGADSASKAHDIVKESGLKLKYYDSSLKTVKEINRSINKEINENAQYRELVEAKPEVIKALYYRNKAEETMYGYDPGEPMQNILKALPKKDRDYMKYFMKAPEEERQAILDMAPGYLRRPLESLWGMTVEEKPSLEKYFQSHQLPGVDWVGWNEQTDLDNVKVKMIKHEGQEFSEFNVWNQDVEEANAAGSIPLPHMNYRTNAYEVRSKLQDLLHRLGLEDVNITVGHTPKNIGVNVNLRKDNRTDIEDQLNNMTV